MNCLAEETNNGTEARQYLLGRLSGEDRTRLEENFFNDDAVFHEIEIAEDELIDAYVRDELSVSDRRYFEQKLLSSPRIAERVKVAGVLAKSAVTQGVAEIAAKSSTAHPVTRFNWKTWFWPTSAFGKTAFASFCAVVVLGVAVMIPEYLRLRRASEKLQEDQAILQKRVEDLTTQNSQNLSERERLNAELEAQRAETARLNEEIERQLDRPVQPIAILPVTLFPGANRAVGESDTLRLQAAPAVFQVNLLLEADEYSSYKAVVSTLSGSEIGQRSDLKAQRSGNGQIVRFRLSSTRFRPGDHLVKLSGTKRSGELESIATYMFRVLPKS
jgi:anti-sigma factor RsiW